MSEQANARKPGADPDAPLVHRAKAGEYEAFEQLVARYERPIYTLAMRIVRRPQDAEEVVQETFLSVVEHLRGFQEQSSFFTWLVRIATNHALKALRKRKRPEVALDASASDDQDAPLPHPDFIAEWRNNPEQLAQQREVRQVVAEALDKLDEKYRLVFLLRDVQGLSTEEAAGALGISVANVKVRLLRARLMLREQLTRRFGDERRRVPPHHDHDE